MIPAFERAKTVHASDRAVTMIGDWKTVSQNTMWLLETYRSVKLFSVVPVR
jgi:hypothetical protein